MQIQRKKQAEVKKQGKKETGRWSKEEHERFMLGIVQHGKDWKKVEQVVGTRSGSQVRSHAQKFFNRLQKEQHSDKEKEEHRQGDISETENCFMKSLAHDEASMNTPVQIVSLIRKQSKQDKTINVNSFMQTLRKLGNQPKQTQTIQDSHQTTNEPQMKQKNSFVGMNNILNAYQNLKEQQQKPKQFENQSFLILLTKKYKKYFGQGGKFENLIDFSNPSEVKQAENSIRKRSFTLLEGEESDEQKLDKIKKKIKVNDQQKQTIKVLGNQKEQTKHEKNQLQK